MTLVVGGGGAFRKAAYVFRARATKERSEKVA